jgi:hypothetical protein
VEEKDALDKEIRRVNDIIISGIPWRKMFGTVIGTRQGNAGTQYMHKTNMGPLHFLSYLGGVFVIFILLCLFPHVKGEPCNAMPAQYITRLQQREWDFQEAVDNRGLEWEAQYHGIFDTCHDELERYRIGSATYAASAPPVVEAYMWIDWFRTSETPDAIAARARYDDPLEWALASKGKLETHVQGAFETVVLETAERSLRSVGLDHFNKKYKSVLRLDNAVSDAVVVSTASSAAVERLDQIQQTNPYLKSIIDISNTDAKTKFKKVVELGLRPTFLVTLRDAAKSNDPEVQLLYQETISKLEDAGNLRKQTYDLSFLTRGSDVAKACVRLATQVQTSKEKLASLSRFEVEQLEKIAAVSRSSTRGTSANVVYSWLITKNETYANRFLNGEFNSSSLTALFAEFVSNPLFLDFIWRRPEEPLSEVAKSALFSLNRLTASKADSRELTETEMKEISKQIDDILKTPNSRAEPGVFANLAAVFDFNRAVATVFKSIEENPYWFVGYEVGDIMFRLAAPHLTKGLMLSPISNTAKAIINIAMASEMLFSTTFNHILIGGYAEYASWSPFSNTPVHGMAIEFDEMAERVVRDRLAGVKLTVSPIVPVVATEVGMISMLPDNIRHDWYGGTALAAIPNGYLIYNVMKDGDASMFLPPALKDMKDAGYWEKMHQTRGFVDFIREASNEFRKEGISVWADALDDASIDHVMFKHVQLLESIRMNIYADAAGGIDAIVREERLLKNIKEKRLASTMPNSTDVELYTCLDPKERTKELLDAWTIIFDEITTQNKKYDFTAN